MSGRNGSSWPARPDPGAERSGAWPDRNAEYLFYQTLVGAWPIDAGRAWAYMEKAAREAKRETSWTRPNPAYEDALRRFVEGTLADPAFRAEVEGFVAPLVAPGRVNSLSQVLWKLAAPGVPDFYQGTELWDLSLVDPDNRRAVDYGLRRRLLAELAAEPPPEEILARAGEGLPKLWLIRQGLALRRRRPELFGEGAGYRPLAAQGERATHLVAFARSARGEPAGVVAAAPRLVIGLDGDWRETTLALPPGTWNDVLTGEERAGEVAAADLLGRFPVALLERR
jgi:(1->4)-alpha-D-glucan 1-alpha-D-glucosylmutase